MQQPKLSFQRLSADDAQKQRECIAVKFEQERVAAAAAAPPAAQPVVKRGPGRPRKKRELAYDAAAAVPPPAQKLRTGEYTNWFSSPYINDVLQALRQHDYNSKRAVEALKRNAPDQRYGRLSDSTVRGWFQKGTHLLLPHFQQQFDAHKAAARSKGRPPAMSADVEEECKRVLLRLRASGLPINSHVIRWTLRAVFEDRYPALLNDLKLSQQWLSHWARSKMQWRWRRRTTAASKLPLDWEQRGVEMAKRVAYRMGMNNVSTLTASGVLHHCPALCSHHAILCAATCRCIHLWSSTWIKLASTWCLLLLGPTTRMARLPSRRSALRINARSQPASRLLCRANFCRCSSSLQAHPTAAILLQPLQARLPVYTSRTALTTGALSRPCRNG